jgi:hypothetical protein
LSRQLDLARRRIVVDGDGLDLYGWRADKTRDDHPQNDDPLIGWRVIDDWPRPVPITSEELDVFEAWFGDILDELFGPA